MADDHDLVRVGLVTILNAQPGIEVVGEARTGDEAVDLARAVCGPTPASWTSGCRASTASKRPGNSPDLM